MSRKDNWYVITGGPSSGKTTILRELEAMGYATVDEAARTFIDEEIAKGKTLEEIRADEGAFQHATFKKKVLLEANSDPKRVTFFDRGMHDTVAYLLFSKELVPLEIEQASKDSIYKKVFLLDMLPYQQDYARTETEEQALELHEMLKKTYLKHSFEIEAVPVLPIEKRVQFILDRL